ncbi:MAG TPA: hypothetical protein VGO00_16295 [Kofleriaceae bacterium]|nr:hypothetical protein [Kofleriaceae bacterium]
MQHNSRIGLGFALLVAGCASPPDQKLPSMSITPHLESTPANAACGDDVTLGADTTPDLRYTFSYDDNGFLTHASGAFAAGGPDDSIDYSYDAAGNFTHMVEAHGWGDSSSEIVASYDASNNLLDYSWSYAQTDYQDSWDYAMSDFGASGPAREDITEAGQPSFGYALVYDGDGRLVQAVPDSGDPISYIYDDAGRTITIDEGNGAFHGLIAYDENFDETSEVWGGSDPQAFASSDVYAWNGEQLVSATYSSGSTDNPQQLALVETDTMQYACGGAAKHSSLRHLRSTRGVARVARDGVN